MENVLPCPSCGTTLGGNTPEGLCPSCLLKAALGAPEPAPALETVPAGKVFGDYEIRGPLGLGGMGVVYAARQVSLNRPVALKMVRAPHLASDSDLARFRQEAEAAARLDHPNIVPVYEAGERDGVQYFTMKLVEGARSLASDLLNGPMNPRDAAKLMLKIARAVHYAHQRGVIHRDIKPANILMDSSGEPQLADFGLAKLLEAAISLTQADRVIGTPQYMSPEQVHGHSRELTTATDIYSLGAVLYEMLTGRPPFQSASIHEILRLLAEKEPKAPRSLNKLVDSDLQTICLKCLEKIPSHRYASANDLADDLESWLDVRPIAARPVTGVERLRKWGRRNPLVAGLGAALVAVGFLAVGILIVDLRKTHAAYQRNLIHVLNGFVHEASAIRSGNREGRRWEALALIEKARKIMEDPDLPKAEAARVEPELRNEAIACLSIVGIRPADEWSPRGKTTLSPDFSRYAEILSDGRIVVNSLPQRHELVSLRVKGVVPLSLRLSANGQRLGVLQTPASTKANRLTIWDVSNPKPVRERDAPAGGIFDLSPDGARVVVSAGSEIQVVEIATDAVVVSIPSAPDPKLLRFSPDGRRIAVLQQDHTVRLIDAGTWETAVCAEAAQARSLAWDAKGRWLAIGGVGQIFLWDTSHRTVKARVLPATGQSGDIDQVAWHPNGRLLASESDGLLVIWNTRTGMEEVQSSVHSHNELGFSPDGTRLGLFQQGRNVGLFEVGTGFGRQAVGHPHHAISGAAWSPEDGHDEEGRPAGGRVLVTAADDAVRFWNREGESVGAIPVTGARSVLWGRRYLFVTGREGIMRWPVRESDDGRSPRLALGRREMMDPRTGWERAALSMPDANGANRWLAVARLDGILVTTPDGERPPVPLENVHGAAFVAISRDDRWLAAGSLSDGVYVWSLPDGRQAAHIGVTGSANVGFTIDGDNHDRSEWLVIGSGTEYAFCKIGTWTIEHRIPTKLGVTYPGAMAFSSRGTALALESKKNEIEIVLPRPPFQFEVAKPDFARQSALSFSPKGGLLVDVDQDWHIIMWHLPRLRADLKPLGLDWKIFGPLIDPDLPLVEEVTVEGEP